MTDFSTLDSIILSALRGSLGHTFSSLSSGAVAAETRRIAATNGTDDFRVLDRRLQALRKVGKIAYNAKTGWKLA